VPSLRDLQARFHDAALLDDRAALEARVRPDALDAAHRDDVFRNNARERFRQALAADYPVVERLVGEQCLGALALLYLREHPSHRDDLQGFGHEFPAFLAMRYGGGEYAYLGDVARLEWAYQEVVIAPDAESVGVDALAAVPAERLELLRLRLQPAVRLVRSRYPILRIWQLNQLGADPQASIDLASGEAVLLRRLESHVELRLIAASDWTLLAGLHAGITLGRAIDAALAEAHDFDLQRALARAFALGLIVQCSVPDSTDSSR
jgi:hypothetical protein